MTDEREFFEGLVYHSNQGRRFTQQSPVMPDVWITYAMKPGQQADLLLEPNWHYTPSDLAAHLSERLKLDKARGDLKKYRQEKPARPQIACNQNVVAVRLWFDQVVRAALPLSNWWRRSVAMLDDGERDALKRILASKSLEKTLALALKENGSKSVPADIIWFARVAGLIGYLGTAKAQATLKTAKSPHEKVERLKEMADDHALIAKSFIGLLKGTAELAPGDDAPLFSVNLNRKSTRSVYASVNAIKGDAARAVFSTKGKGIAWAVVDSGIDARHLAFRKYERQGGEEKRCKDPFPAESRRRVRVPTKERRFANNTRIVASYDFVNIRELLGAEPEEVDSPAFRKMFPILKDKAKRDELKALLAARASHVIDWQRLDPFIRIPHNEQGYREPGNRHGTHVAGIIAADWRVEKRTDDGNPSQGIDLVGVAPDVELYDFRVLDDNGEGSEFGIMSALQLVRDLNNRRDFMAIHGANLSFSIQHDVANYACGRTPVCEEAERLVSSGIVVVAAAGNSGRARYVTPSGLEDEGFRTVSITDPGNAASVITVGSTHRSDAHTYGVSYFSSRGPTGDGRLKPDLVAPGEKIRSTVPQNGDALLDGTSMAAPHASGAAALLLSRHPEFIGQPQRVKEILCKTATDLGRERYFQGAGLIDILRALQSV